MNIADYYRILELSSGASFSEVKASYRRLARLYHPDVNPGDHQAKEKFIELTEAYQQLLTVLSDLTETEFEFDAFAGHVSESVEIPKSAPKVTIPPLSPQDQSLKQSSYEQLRELLKMKRFARAIALVEALRDRLPFDPEVRQWQAITYQSQGQYLVKQQQVKKGQLYLQKALRTDPHNRRLCLQIENDLNRLKPRN